MKKMKYIDILKENRALKKSLGVKEYKIGILTNMTNHLLKDIREYSLRFCGINAEAELGDYDNIVQDAHRFNKNSLVIVFWDLINILQGPHKLRRALIDDYTAVRKDLVSQIDLVMSSLQSTPLVIFNRFTGAAMSTVNPVRDILDILAEELNEYMESLNRRNVFFIDLLKIFLKEGINLCVDWEGFYKKRCLYTLAFYNSYCEFIVPVVKAINGRMKKMLILDCDNTLWGGIVGEDGVDGIDLSPDTPEGAIFLEVQALIKGFSKAGVLIALCSKNSLEDVDNVLKRHPRMILSDHDISMKTINWNDKVDNIRLIATTMNIGLDSLVFLDDSLFEIEHVRSFLPEVSTFRVPEKLYEYPALIREISGLFYNGFQTQEDLSKQEMYRQNFERVSFKGEFDSLDDYLASLNVKLVCYDNNPSLAPRMAQLSQKTNQFNLTTIRYTERQIEDFIADPNYDVLSYRVKDKFGDSGVTILVILRYAFHLHTAVVDSFLMSCRIIGRNIEFSVMNHIVKQMQGKGLYYIEADYIPTTKNALTASFYDKCSFQLLGASDHPGKKYKLSIKDYQPMDVTYEVVYEREN